MVTTIANNVNAFHFFTSYDSSIEQGVWMDCQIAGLATPPRGVLISVGTILKVFHFLEISVFVSIG